MALGQARCLSACGRTITVLRDLYRVEFPNDPPSFSLKPYDFDRQAANFLKHADRDPKAVLYEIDPLIPEFVFFEAVSTYRDLTGVFTNEMHVANSVLDMKYGFSEAYEARAERRRDEERERERRMEDMDGDEREEERGRMERDKCAYHSALLNIGRSMLTGHSLWPKTG